MLLSAPSDGPPSQIHDNEIHVQEQKIAEDQVGDLQEIDEIREPGEEMEKEANVEKYSQLDLAKSA